MRWQRRPLALCVHPQWQFSGTLRAPHSFCANVLRAQADSTGYLCLCYQPRASLCRLRQCQRRYEHLSLLRCYGRVDLPLRSTALHEAVELNVWTVRGSVRSGPGSGPQLHTSETWYVPLLGPTPYSSLMMYNFIRQMLSTGESDHTNYMHRPLCSPRSSPWLRQYQRPSTYCRATHTPPAYPLQLSPGLWTQRITRCCSLGGYHWMRSNGQLIELDTVRVTARTIV